MHHFACKSVRKKYQEVLAEKLRVNIVKNSEVYTEGCWSVLRTSLLVAAVEEIGYATDWFKESSEVLIKRMLLGEECYKMIFHL